MREIFFIFDRVNKFYFSLYVWGRELGVIGVIDVLVTLGKVALTPKKR